MELEVMRITRAWPKVLPVLALAGIVAGSGFLAACKPATETEVLAPADYSCGLPPKTTAMDTQVAGNKVIAAGAIPPIDAVAPTRTETATFAMG